jgi:hypothetical protein
MISCLTHQTKMEIAIWTRNKIALWLIRNWILAYIKQFEHSVIFLKNMSLNKKIII